MNDQNQQFPEVEWKQSFGATVAHVNGVAIGCITLRGRPDAIGAFEVTLYHSRAMTDTPAASAFVTTEPAARDRLLKMAKQAVSKSTPSDVLAAVHLPKLEPLLRATHADQGGGSLFGPWVHSTADDPQEVGHAEAKQYLEFGGDLQSKDLRANGRWIPTARSGIDADGVGKPAVEAIDRVNAILREANLPTYMDLLQSIETLGTTNDRLGEKKVGVTSLGRDISDVASDAAIFARGILDRLGYERRPWVVDQTRPAVNAEGDRNTPA